MKRKLMIMASATLLSSSVFFSSCIGSFTLFNKLLTWNENVDNQWVNELIFVILSPAYGVAWFTDALVLNSIEFWTGKNPAQEVNVQTKQLETENGLFSITTDTKSHTIRKADSGETIEFRFNTDMQRWDLLVDEQIHPLLQFIENNQVLVYLADGSTVRVDSNQAGVMAFRQAVKNKAYLATK
jgi:hypothetical protein